MVFIWDLKVAPIPFHFVEGLNMHFYNNVQDFIYLFVIY
jgi:hypothetical protein